MGVFKKIFLWVLFVSAALMLLGYYFAVSGVEYSVIVNGRQVHGFPGAALATGWLLVAGLATAGALALVALLLAGTSMILLGVMAVFFLALLFLFSPLLVPVAAVVLLVALAVRKRKEKSPCDSV
jgi:hypothetical protein